MKVVLNSDVLFHPNTLLRVALQRGLPELFEACREHNHVIVIPLTTRLEFERHQREEAERERGEIRKAYELLRAAGVELEERDAAELAVEPDLMQLIGASGVAVMELEPSADELREAHRRAALHEPPQPPDARSDEMRDLVIWVQAINLARVEGGAVLLSLDNLHNHARGDDEAEDAGLVRLRNVSDVLEYLRVRTPAAQLINRLLLASWDSVRGVRPDLPATIELSAVGSPSFVMGETGVAAAESHIEGVGPNGERIEAEAIFQVDGGAIVLARLRELHVDGQVLEDAEAAPNAQVELTGLEEVDGESLEQLRRILES